MKAQMKLYYSIKHLMPLVLMLFISASVFCSLFLLLQQDTPSKSQRIGTGVA